MWRDGLDHNHPSPPLLSSQISPLNKNVPLPNYCFIIGDKGVGAMGVNNMIVGVTDRDSNKDDLIAAGQNQCYEKPLNIEKMKTILKDCNLY